MSITKVLLILGLILVSVTGYFLLKPKGPQPMKYGEVIALNERVASVQEKKDKEVLLSEKSVPSAALYGAMLRRAHKNDPIAFSRAKELVESEDLLLKRGAIESLGYLPDEEVLRIFQQNLLSQEPTVRLSALKALGHGNSLERKKIIAQQVSKKRTMLEMREGYRQLYFSYSDHSEKKQIINEILKLYERGAFRESIGLLELIVQLDPKNEFVLNLAKKAIDEEIQSAKGPMGPDRLNVFFIKYLNRNDVKFIKNRQRALFVKASTQVKKALLSVFFQLCPEAPLADLMRWVETTSDKKVLEKIYLNISLAGTPEAKNALGEIITKTKPKGRMKEYLEGLVKNFKEGHVANPTCATST